MRSAACCAVLLASCASSPSVWDRAMSVRPASLEDVAADSAPTADAWARATVQHDGFVPCAGRPGVSVRVTGRPIVGRAWTAQWTSVPTTPPEPPAAVFVLLASTRRATPARIPASDRCWLWVHPDFVLLPGSTPGLSQSGGRAWLSIDSVPASLSGQDFFFQMLVADDVLGHGLRVSPMLHVTAGAR